MNLQYLNILGYELEGKLTSDIYKVKFSDLKKIFKNKSLLFLFLQGFFGVFP